MFIRASLAAPDSYQYQVAWAGPTSSSSRRTIPERRFFWLGSWANRTRRTGSPRRAGI